MIPRPIVGQRSLGAATGDDGVIYVLGGCCASGFPLTVAEAYDPATGTWSPLPPMPVARGGLVASLGLDREILAIGGFTGPQSNPIASDLVEAFHP